MPPKAGMCAGAQKKCQMALRELERYCMMVLRLRC
jgi:hypothetical protein